MEQSSSRHLDLRASILSPTRNGCATVDKTTLLADAEGLPPQQAPPGSNPALIHTNVHCLYIAHRLRYDGPMYHIPFHTFIPFFEDGKSINNTIFRKKPGSGTKSDRYT